MTTPPPALPQLPRPRELRIAALAGGALLLALAWVLSPVLLLAFAGLLLALALLHAARPLVRRWGWSERAALACVVLTLAAFAVAGSWLAGASALEQLQALGETLPKAWEAVKQWLAGHRPGRWLLQAWNEAQLKPEDWQRVAGWATLTLNATIGAIGSAVLVLFVGVYLAADPRTYRRGLLRLVPPARRALAEQTFDAIGRNLVGWMRGQAVSMLAVALAMGIGLSLIGMPLALTLALIAGVIEFVPYFGTLVSSVLIVAVALTEGEQMAMWALLVCLAVQQAESYIVQPLAQRWATRMPPVLGMLSVLVFGVLFGLPGVLLAVPLMVVCMTLVEHLYVRALLGVDAEAAQNKVPR